jgi:hypothetical protein
MIDIHALHRSQLDRRTATNPVQYSCAIEAPPRRSDRYVWIALAAGFVAAMLSALLT